VVDIYNDRVQKFSSSGFFVNKFGSQGNEDGQFNNPYGVGVDASDYVYVTDTLNHDVSKFDGDTLQFDSKWGGFGSGAGKFNMPSDVAFSASGKIYVIDNDNNRVQVFNSEGSFEREFGSEGSGEGQFLDPAGIAIDSAGYIYVTDNGNFRIQKFEGEDTTPPTGSFVINDGASSTNDRTITLTLEADDASGVAEMRFSDNNVTWSTWQPYETSVNWTLPEGDGQKTVYVQFKDNSGLISTTSSMINLVTQSSLWGIPLEYVLIVVVIVVAAVIFVIYKFLKRPKKPPAPAQLRITAEPLSLVADGETKSVITLQLLDKKGTPISALNDTQVKIDAPRGSLADPIVVVPKGKDSKQTFIVSSTDSGQVPVTAEAEGLNSVTVTLNFVEKKRYCMHCGALLSSDAKSCGNCGKAPPAGKDTKVCHNCKSVIPAVAKFCSECASGQE
jgi:ribosomal protein L40E